MCIQNSAEPLLPHPAGDVISNKNKAKQNPKCLKHLSCYWFFFFFDSHPPLGSSLCLQPSCLFAAMVTSQQWFSTGEAGEWFFALQGTRGSVWKHLRLSSWEGKATVIQCVETRDVAKHPKGQSPTAKNHPIQNASCAEAEKPWSTGGKIMIVPLQGWDASPEHLGLFHPFK